MSFPASLPPAVLEMFAGFLLPLILPHVADDRSAARSMALYLLAAYQPCSARELSLAAEIVASNLKMLTMLVKSAEPALPAADVSEAMKWACHLSRAGRPAQRQFDELQRLRRLSERWQQLAGASAPPESGATVPPVASEPEPGPATPEVAPEELSDMVLDSANAHPSERDTASQPADAPGSINAMAQAEKALASAEKLLALMQQHVKGGVPPQSQAAQQIRDQHKAVDVARMRLQQLRRLHAAAAA